MTRTAWKAENLVFRDEKRPVKTKFISDLYMTILHLDLPRVNDAFTPR